MRRVLSHTFGVLCVLAIVALGARGASAHEHRAVLDGRYQLIVGFLNEPAVSGELNSVDLRVSDLSQATPSATGGDPTGAPVTGLESTLTVDIIFSDQTRTLELEARWGTPGAYNGYLIPVTPGDYSFHIYGTINGEVIDEIFTPGPETFSSVGDRAELEFPVTASSPTASTAAIAGVTGDGGGSGSGTGGIWLAVLAVLGAAGVAGTAFARRTPRPAPIFASSAGD